MDVKTLDLKSLRRQLRARRRALPAWKRLQAARQVAQFLIHHPFFFKVRHIGVYQATDGELDLRYFIQAAEASGKRCYWPRVHDRSERRMDFCEGGSAVKSLKTDRFGIPIPAARRVTISPRRLDWILVPLVGVDRFGHRLGRGKGYYDVYLQRMKQDGRFWGICYDFQRIGSWPARSWDVPVNRVVTPRGVFPCWAPS